jgi:hypothetical protein
MKIVFVENRYKTVLFEKIAKELEIKGIKSHFLVQNRFFSPKNIDFKYLGLPSSNHLGVPNQQVNKFELEKKDRGYKYFKSGNQHYNYYYHEIKSFLLSKKPVCVFGESTLFHELITIEVCKELKIKYLHPTSCRYPIGRMSFYEYDTLIPFNESTDIVVENEDIVLARSIAQREVVPEYMTQTLTRLQKLKNKFHSIFTLTISYYLGERFNTPSPFLKYKLNKELAKSKKDWEAQAVKTLGGIKDWNKTLLYPLQMQPEANLDVWGFPYNNQEENIQKLLSVMPSDWQLIIKPNPKSKFELSENLINVVSSDLRCVAVSHELEMEELFHKSAVFFAVTGTICFECVFANKIFFSSSLPQIKLFAPSQYGFPETNFFSTLKKVKLKQKPSELIAYLKKNSFKGVVSDHLHSNYAYKSENISDLTNAFIKVISQLSR